MKIPEWIRFNEYEDVCSSIDLLARLLANVEGRPSDWKWIIIAAHTALQGALICALSGTANVGALDSKSARVALQWFEDSQTSPKTEYPDGRIAAFKTLLCWAQQPDRMMDCDQPFILTTQQVSDLYMLHDYRCQFAHFFLRGKPPKGRCGSSNDGSRTMDDFLILSRRDLRELMRFADYVEAVAEGIRLLARGRCQSPVPTEIPVHDGTFHVKAGSLPRGAGYVAAKINGNFPANRTRHGLPTIQGAVRPDHRSGLPAAPANFENDVGVGASSRACRRG